MIGIPYWAQAAATPFSSMSVENLFQLTPVKIPNGEDHIQGELGLHRDDIGVFDGFVDGLRPHLGERNASDLAGLDILLLDEPKRHVQRHRRVPTAEFKHIDLLAALELRNAVIQGAAGILRRGVDLVGFGVGSAFDIQDDLVRIFGVFFQVAFEENEAVVIWRAIEFTAVPAGAYRC